MTDALSPFALVDWLVVLGVLAATTWIGHRGAGRQDDARDFFLGGRRLPWYAVAASLVATEISAVTFVALPASVAAAGGDLTYLQIVLIGSVIARGLVAQVLVPAYFEREIYSPYDFVGQRLGRAGRLTTTWFFSVGGVLAQAARVYLTAVVLELLLREPLAALQASTGCPPLAAAVGVVAVVAVLWTWMGGIATVVWTDAVLFLLFVAGVLVVGVSLDSQLEGGIAGALSQGAEAGKLRWIDLGDPLRRPYVLWSALFLVSWGMVGDYGCNQLLVQRVLCCSSVREARRAVLASTLGTLVIAAIALLGVGLWAFVQEVGWHAELAPEVEGNRVLALPAYLLQAVGPGWKGLVLAGVFAAAISSLDSILAALSQTTLTVLGRGGPDDPRAVGRSRWLVVGFAVLLGSVALGLEALQRRFGMLDLALAMGGLTSGVLLGSFALALWARRLSGDGLAWGAGAAFLVVLACAQVDPLPEGVHLAAGLVLALGYLTRTRRIDGAFLLVLVAAGATWLRTQEPLPWTWFAPVGALLTAGLGAWLDSVRVDQPSRAIRSSSD